MSGIIVTNRTNLLKIFSDMKFSQAAKHETMLLFGKLETHEQKEEAAKRAIPVVKSCKTEQEAVKAVSRVIEQMKQ